MCPIASRPPRPILPPILGEDADDDRARRLSGHRADLFSTISKNDAAWHSSRRRFIPTIMALPGAALGGRALGAAPSTGESSVRILRGCGRRGRNSWCSAA